ncbi:MAG: ABC transporter substrate-binding protein [Rhodospirillales bacterium]
MLTRTIATATTGLCFAAALSLSATDRAVAEKAVDQDWPEMSWEEILAEAKGETVNWYMWGGSDTINTYVSSWVADQVKERYDIDLKRIGIDSTVEAVNKVLGEKEAGVDTGGGVDLIWINGRNFQTMKQGDMLFCGYMDVMPNNRYINWDDPTIAFDFGIPVDFCEVPWGRAQMVMVYDPTRLENPPKTIPDLVQWVKANPGRFTYPAPPDFTGMFFVKHVLYSVAGGFEPFIGPFDQKVYDEVAPKLWATLNEMAPALWRRGETYPADRAALHQLFANGEIDFTVATHPDSVGKDIDKGTFPPTTKSYVLDDGTVGDVHYVAIPGNAAHKAAAVVVANFLISPEAQLEKAKPSVWGVRSALDLTRVPAEWQENFTKLPRHPAVVSDADLARAALPQPNSEWVSHLEKGWRDEVAAKN